MASLTLAVVAAGAVAVSCADRLRHVAPARALARSRKLRLVTAVDAQASNIARSRR